jgi:hypothetical protein
VKEIFYLTPKSLFTPLLVEEGSVFSRFTVVFLRLRNSGILLYFIVSEFCPFLGAFLTTFVVSFMNCFLDVFPGLLRTFFSFASYFLPSGGSILRFITLDCKIFLLILFSVHRHDIKDASVAPLTTFSLFSPLYPK